VGKAVLWAKENLPTAEELIDYCEKKKLCPYEINKQLIRDSPVVVVPYIYVFYFMIRNMLFDWLAISEEDMILVVDEAHNLPDYIRDLFSVQLSSWMLNSCLFEAEKFGDPAMLDGRVTVSEFCKILIEIVSGIRDTYVYGILESGIKKKQFEKLDAFIPSHEFEAEVMSRLKITSKKFHDIIGDLIAYGEKIQEYRQKEGKLARSYIHRLGGFLDSWVNIEMEQYAKLVVDSGDGKNPRIESYCLDPSIGTDILKDFHSSIHMSGTLEPLEEYRDSLGLSSDTELVAYQSPFPKENRRILFVNDVTTKYDEIAKDEKIVSRMRQYITDVCNTFPRNTMVCFPSFDSLTGFLRGGIRDEINRSIYVEEQGMQQMALMDLVNDFKQSKTPKNSETAAINPIIAPPRIVTTGM